MTYWSEARKHLGRDELIARGIGTGGAVLVLQQVIGPEVHHHPWPVLVLIIIPSALASYFVLYTIANRILKTLRGYHSQP